MSTEPGGAPRINPAEVEAVRQEAEMVCTEAQVDAAFERMASAVTEALGARNPLVLALMVGGLFPTGRLLPKLDFPLEVDYIHATRYRGKTQGRDLHWRAHPTTPLKNRSVLVVDDILDEGLTLAAVLDHCKEAGAREVYSAVLAEKRHDRKPLLKRADFTGLEVPDRYVFGCGLDYRGYLRNVPGIYAVKGL